MERGRDITGYSLIETVVVASFLAMVAAIGFAGLPGAISAAAARTSADVWQAGVYVAQHECLWGTGRAVLEGGSTAVALRSEDGCGRGPTAVLPVSARVEANVSRWTLPDGVRVGFSGPFGAPNAGGSLFFDDRLRLTIRPESGYVTRARK